MTREQIREQQETIGAGLLDLIIGANSCPYGLCPEAREYERIANVDPDPQKRAQAAASLQGLRYTRQRALEDAVQAIMHLEVVKQKGL